jgi:acyl-CoA thioester hydrolase
MSAFRDGGFMDYRFVATIKVYFRDIDSMGHVNNAAYLSYLEIARMELYEQIFGEDGFHRYPYILAEVTVKYKSPAYIRERLKLGIAVSQIRTKSFEFSYIIVEEKTGRVVAEAKTVQVMFDYQKQKTMEIPEEWRRKVQEFFKGATS